MRNLETLTMEGDWSHKLADNVVSAVVGAVAGVFGTLLTRASKRSVESLATDLAGLRQIVSAHENQFGRIEEKLTALLEQFREFRREMKHRRDTDE